jgi:predicted MFS family arabinose efflux permease
MDKQARRSAFTVVPVLAICFGLVGLDRFVINPLFPVIADDLGLGYQDIGLISAVLALTWGVAAILMGRLTDRVGVRRVLVPAILAFSVLVGLTGLATGLVGLLLIRGLLGLAEGTFVPGAIVATTRVSRPSRVGLNVGVLHMAAALFGLGLAPLLATQLLKVVPSWHWVFATVAIPGLIMTYVLYRSLPPETEASLTAPAEGQARSWRAAMGRRPVLANAVAMACWLASVTTLGALLPSYLTDRLGLSLDQMGIVLSGLGLGGVLGMIVVPWLGDRQGHRAVAVIAIAIQIVVLGVFSLTPADVPRLFALSIVIGVTGAGVTAITVGPLTSRAVAGTLAATATGIVVGFGEIVGGALAPAAAGLLASDRGIAVVPLFAMGAAAIGLVALALGAERTSRATPVAPPA